MEYTIEKLARLLAAELVDTLNLPLSDNQKIRTITTNYLEDAYNVGHEDGWESAQDA